MPRLGTITWLGVGGAAGAVVLVVALVATNPAVIGPVGVTLWFVLLLGVLTASLTLMLYGLKSYFNVHGSRQARLRYSLRQGLLIGGWATGQLALASLGQLGWRDVILLGLTAIIIELYVRFRWP